MNSLQFIINELLSWRAALDIFIIAAGLFFLYRTLVRLGTLKILVGIVAAFLMFALAKLLRLEGIEWVFQNVSQVAVVALIVIFQPELRKILEKVVSLHGISNSSGDRGLAEIIAESLWELALQRRGAIIVYPGNEPVAEQLSGGQRLNAEASVPLLMSIFDPHSPGHDGAVIIEDNELVSFGVRLPMSQTARLPEAYGTRHHAAMGLAEQTDALVLVVSEERGVVSVFRNGTMTKMNSAAEIIEQIKDHQVRHGILGMEQINRIDRRIALRAGVCLLIAGVFWIVLVSAQKQMIERTFIMPIEYGPPAQGLMPVGEMAEQAKVRLAGPRSVIDDLLMDQQAIHIDLAGMVEGTQTILLSRDQLGVDGATFISSVPAQVEVTLARIVKTMVPVEPQLVGKLPDGLKLKQVVVKPAKLQALAPPLKRNQKIVAISTTPVYLNTIRGNTRIFCKVIAPGTMVPVNKTWQDVEVAIEVESTSP